MSETTDGAGRSVRGCSGPDLLDVKLLRLFDLLYVTRSVTRAAETLGQSQPTVSIWLARLRRLMNDPLFVRTPDGMQPTPRADALIATVRETLDGLRRLSAAPPRFDPATATRRFSICMTDASHINLLPDLLVHIRETAPNVQLEAAQIDGTTGDRLRAGEVDLAIGLVPDLATGFMQQTLFGQDWVCLTNRDHPRIRRALSLAAYVGEGHISVTSGTGYRLLNAALEAQGIERRIVLALPGFLGLAAILLRTDLIATLPRQTGETLAATGLSLFPSPFPIEGFTVKQYWHARLHHDPGHRWLRSVCETLFQARRATARPRQPKRAPGPQGHASP